MKHGTLRTKFWKASFSSRHHLLPAASAIYMLIIHTDLSSSIIIIRHYQRKLNWKDLAISRICSPEVASLGPLSGRMPLKTGKRRVSPPNSPLPRLQRGDRISSCAWTSNTSDGLQYTSARTEPSAYSSGGLATTNFCCSTCAATTSSISPVSPLPTLETGRILPWYGVPKRQLVKRREFLEPCPRLAPITTRSMSTLAMLASREAVKPRFSFFQWVLLSLVKYESKQPLMISPSYLRPSTSRKYYRTLARSQGKRTILCSAFRNTPPYGSNLRLSISGCRSRSFPSSQTTSNPYTNNSSFSAKLQSSAFSLLCLCSSLKGSGCSVSFSTNTISPSSLILWIGEAYSWSKRAL